MTDRIRELRQKARYGTGSGIYRCRDHKNRARFFCSYCLPYIWYSVEADPMANWFVRCERCGIRNKDNLLTIFIFWFLGFWIFGFVPLGLAQFGIATHYRGISMEGWTMILLAVWFIGSFVIQLVNILLRR